MVEITPFAAWNEAQREEAAAILVRALAHAPSAWANLTEARAEVASFSGAERMAFGAIESGTMLGWIGAITAYQHGWELHPLVVEPAEQRRGIGTRLCQHLEGTARAAGIETLYVGTDDDFGGTSLFGETLFPDPLAAVRGLSLRGGHPLAFYRKIGWQVVGVLPNVNGRGKHDILMAKDIGLHAAAPTAPDLPPES